ncbi:hypothetical protein [Geomobilimonas luticola]|uniref:Uncharacterized protein n=1 Tax=Geomobilimonas luticola TaxID=1114878 RepID=A0ABS5SF34_9BACT|nr:hypothetical protein [Geomobilimonas luticola]MBT0653973.1 hypothetical protein [Geomobilimonas luticola]
MGLDKGNSTRTGVHTEGSDVRKKLTPLLSRMPPLSVVNPSELCTLIPEHTPSAVMAALATLVTGTSDDGPDFSRHALGMAVDCPDNTVRQLLFSLPGLPRDHILDDFHVSNRADLVVQELCEIYGRKTIEYWGYATQRRAVERARRGMNRVVASSRICCRVCELLGRNYPHSTPRPVSACHMISRRAVFWRRVREVHGLTSNIFCDDAVELLTRKLRSDRFHHNDRYLLHLCREHDKLFVGAVVGTDASSHQHAPYTTLEQYLF